MENYLELELLNAQKSTPTCIGSASEFAASYTNALVYLIPAKRRCLLWELFVSTIRRKFSWELSITSE